MQTRRKFMGSGAYTALGVVSGLAPACAAKAGGGLKVAVIGGGMAGLAAANYLAGKGAQPFLLEARERLGGRLHTARPWGDGLPLDMGASWIHGKNNPVWKLAKKHGINTIETNNEAHKLFTPGGQLIKYCDKFEERTLNLAEEACEEGKSNDSIARALKREEFYAKFEPSKRRLAHYTLHTVVEQEAAADLDELSAWYADEGEHLIGGDHLPAKGYDTFIPLLLGKVPVTMGAVTKAITTTKGGVSIETAKGNFEADAAVITLPLGVLQKSSVNLPLPGDMRRSIHALGMGCMNKLYLRFPKVFWPMDVDWIGRMPPGGAFRWCEFLNIAKYHKEPVLVCFNVGDEGRAVEKLSPKAQAEQAYEALIGMFGKGTPRPNAWLASKWASDPFAGGSYSFMKAGATPKDRKRLRMPFGNERLYLAGEASSVDFPCSVQGAYLEGQRAAKAILKKLG